MAALSAAVMLASCQGDMGMLESDFTGSPDTRSQDLIENPISVIKGGKMIGYVDGVAYYGIPIQIKTEIYVAEPLKIKVTSGYGPYLIAFEDFITIPYFDASAGVFIPIYPCDYDDDALCAIYLELEDGMYWSDTVYSYTLPGNGGIYFRFSSVEKEFELEWGLKPGEDFLDDDIMDELWEEIFAIYNPGDGPVKNELSLIKGEKTIRNIDGTEFYCIPLQIKLRNPAATDVSFSISSTYNFVNTVFYENIEISNGKTASQQLSIPLYPCDIDLVASGVQIYFGYHHEDPVHEDGIYKYILPTHYVYFRFNVQEVDFDYEWGDKPGEDAISGEEVTEEIWEYILELLEEYSNKG